MRAMPDRANRDTSPEADRVQFDLLRAMTPVQRAERMSALTLAVQQLACAGIKQRYPEASDEETWLRLAAQRLGRDTMRAVYGFDPELE